MMLNRIFVSGNFISVKLVTFALQSTAFFSKLNTKFQVLDIQQGVGKENALPLVELIYYDLVYYQTYYDLLDIKFKISIQLLKVSECKETCGAENVLYLDLGGSYMGVYACACMW